MRVPDPLIVADGDEENAGPKAHRLGTLLYLRRQVMRRDMPRDARIGGDRASDDQRALPVLLLQLGTEQKRNQSESRAHNHQEQRHLRKQCLCGEVRCGLVPRKRMPTTIRPEHVGAEDFVGPGHGVGLRLTR